MKLQKCLITFLFGFSLLFSGALISCGDTPGANENGEKSELSEVNEDEKKTDNEKENDKESDKESDKDADKSKDSEDSKDSKTDEKTDDTQTLPAASEFTVTFNTDGGSAVTSQTVKKDAKAKKPATDPTKTGCKFEGWYSDSKKTKTFSFDTAITANTTVYAKWTILSGYYEVTFNTNGGSAVPFEAVESGKKATKPANPTKTNARFDKWYSDAELTNEFDFNTVITEATTVYAKWIDLINVSGISLSQESAGEITKSESGYVFTAPAGYSSYHWMISGYNFISQDLDGENNIWTLENNFASKYGEALVDGVTYMLVVAGVDENNKTQGLFKTEFVYHAN